MAGLIAVEHPPAPHLPGWHNPASNKTDRVISCSGSLSMPFGPATTLNETSDGLFKAADKNFDRTGRLMETEEALFCQHLAAVEFLDARYVFTRFHAGPGKSWVRRGRRRRFYCFFVLGQQVFGDTKARKVDAFVVLPGGRWKIYNYHEDAHFLGRKTRSHSVGCLEEEGEECRERNWETQENDAFNQGLAKALTAAGVIEVEYDFKSKCDYFHNHINGTPGPFNTTDPGFCLPPAWTKKTMTHQELLDNVMSCTDLGFVCLQNGSESVRDAAGAVTGFCLGRHKVTAAELGPEAVALEAERRNLKRRSRESDEAFARRCRDSATAALNKRGGQGYTMLRRGYKEICLPVNQFRWLVKERGLTGFKIKHYICYPGRMYLSEFMTSILQKRHELNLAGMKDSVMAHVFKLYLNGAYGYNLIQASDFTSHTFACESSLRKNAKYRSGIRSLTIAGYDSTRTNLEITYLVERDSGNRQNVNLCHVAGTILGWSRVTLYTGIMDILNHVDCSLCYVDTDSIILEVGCDNLLDCVKPDKLSSFLACKNNIFEEPDSPLTQAGKR